MINAKVHLLLSRDRRAHWIGSPALRGKELLSAECMTWGHEPRDRAGSSGMQKA